LNKYTIQIIWKSSVTLTIYRLSLVILVGRVEAQSKQPVRYYSSNVLAVTYKLMVTWLERCMYSQKFINAFRSSHIFSNVFIIQVYEKSY